MSYSAQRHINTFDAFDDGDSDGGSSCSFEVEEEDGRRMSAFSIETGDEIYDLSPTPHTRQAYARKKRSARRCRCAAFFLLTFAVFVGYLLFAVVGGGRDAVGRMWGSGGGGGGGADDVSVVTDGSEGVQGGGEGVDGAGGEIPEFPDDVPPPTSEGEDGVSDEDEYGGLPFRVLDFIPHDPSSFTQGLTYYDGILYESTGLYKQSKVRRLDPTTGDVLDSVNIDPKLFGEGMTCVGTGPNTGGCESLVQITWKSKRGFVYDPTTLEMLHEFEYQTQTTEGWGITYIPETHELVVSDGSEYLHFWSGTYPFGETRERVRVVRPGDGGGGGVEELNELEYVGGHILANIWFSDAIIAINPMTGEVRGEYDFGSLWPKGARNRGADVLNGISVSDKEGELFVTGKKWGKIFRVSIDGFMPTPLDADWMGARKEDGEDDEDDGNRFRVLGTIPHDPTSFTQGLTYFNGILYESTGLYGESKVRRLDPTSGDVLASVEIAPDLFGEGMTCVGTGPNTGGCDSLVQVTWKSARGLVYDPTTLEMTQEFSYRTQTTQGWGITYIPETHELVVSDGSEYLHFWSGTYPFEETRERVPVLRPGDSSPVRSLNELEYVGGSVLANIWQQDAIVRINPSTGEVEEEYDFRSLWPHEERSRGSDVLNGISLSDREGELFVTGKKWPQVYRVFFKGLVRDSD